MDYNELGQTSLKVSSICLGTMTFGEQNTEEEGFEQMDRAVDCGVNFFDTAEMYPVPSNADTQGSTETIVGNWLKARGKRHEIILATKVSGKSNWLPHIRDGRACGDRENIVSALESSLQRLNTDYIDLYQIHWPDRRTNFFGSLGYVPDESDQAVSIEQTLEVLAEIVQSGKVRYIGISNETAWGTMEYLRVSREFNYPRIVSIQNPYNLLNRSFEVGLAEIAHREKVGLLAYSPLGFGALTGKYINNNPANCRLTLFPQFARYKTPTGIKATEKYVNLCKQFNLSPAQMALAFVNSRPFITSNIIGATSMLQLNENLASADIHLSDELLTEIESVHEQISNPCP